MALPGLNQRVLTVSYKKLEKKNQQTKHMQQYFPFGIDLGVSI